MDFWDLTKLLVRRWVIVIPLLLLSAGVTVWVTTNVQPDYTAMAYVQLIPPVASETTEIGEPTVDDRNPWVGLGLQTLGNAAIVTISDQRVVDDLKDAGYSDSYTLTMSDQSPLVTLEIVGESRQQVRDTADRLSDQFTESVNSLQTAYGVAEGDLITVRRLDMGTNITKSTSKTKRALVAVAGAGILMTIAVTVGLDAWLRHRRARRGSGLPAPGAATEPARQEQRDDSAAGDARETQSTPPARADQERNDQSEAPQERESHDDEHPREQVVAQEDATVVLPSTVT